MQGANITDRPTAAKVHDDVREHKRVKCNNIPIVKVNRYNNKRVNNNFKTLTK